jgi:phosphohistidine phosphatase SixA
MRHGDRDRKSGLPERLQTLDEKGRKRVNSVACKIRDHLKEDEVPDLVLASSNRHALETAEIICRTLGVTSQIITDDHLAPGNPEQNLKGIVSMLVSLNYRIILLVGHLPHVSNLLLHLTSWRVPIDRSEVYCVGFQRPDDTNTILWRCSSPDV